MGLYGAIAQQVERTVEARGIGTRSIRVRPTIYGWIIQLVECQTENLNAEVSSASPATITKTIKNNSE